MKRTVVCVVFAATSKKTTSYWVAPAMASQLNCAPEPSNGPDAVVFPGAAPVGVAGTDSATPWYVAELVGGVPLLARLLALSRASTLNTIVDEAPAAGSSA